MVTYGSGGDSGLDPRERVRGAVLGPEERDFLETAAMRFRPFYVRALEGRSPGRGLGWIPRALVLAFGPYALWAGLAAAVGHGSVVARAWYVLYLPGVVLAGLALLHHAYRIMVDPHTLRPLLEGTCDTNAVQQLERHLHRMWTHRGQIAFLSLFALAGGANILLMQPAFPAPLDDLPWFLTALLTVYAGYMLFMSGPGVWLAFTSLTWVNSYAAQGCLRIQGMRPHRHMGLRVVASVMGTYALSFSFECSLVLSAFYAWDWKEGYAVITLARNLWLCVWIPFIAAYFIYPQYRIGRVAYEAKQALVGEISGKIDGLYYGAPDHDLETIERILKYTELLDKLQSERAHVWDLSAAYRFASALIVPVIVFLVQNPDATVAVWRYVKGLF